MTLSVLFDTLLATDNAVLPSLTGMRVALHVFWALVLGSATMLISHKLPRAYRLGLTIFVMSWTLLPGTASPAYWLGLAFQTPSLTSAVICLVWLVSRRPWVQTGDAHLGGHPIGWLAAVGMVLGWVLLLDTLAWLPVSVYAWGFSSAAFACVAAGVTVAWVVGVRAHVGSMFGPTVVLCVLALFALTRLPTGNVWDALMDPWLWVALQAYGLFNVVRRLKFARRA